MGKGAAVFFCEREANGARVYFRLSGENAAAADQEASTDDRDSYFTHLAMASMTSGAT